jgi:hypothetical protein
VLLMQMANHTGAAGLNLTCASAAYIMEPAMAPAIEAQAARIYRLGECPLTPPCLTSCPLRLVLPTPLHRVGGCPRQLP